MSLKDIKDIQDDKVKIKGKAWDESGISLFAAKKIYQFQQCVDYWQPILDRGRSLEDKYEGRILGDEQRAVYETVEHKIVIEPHIMKAPIRALIGQTLKSRKSGQVVTEDGSMADPAAHTKEIDTINVVMKDIETQTLEEYRIKEAVHSAFVNCYWNVIMFDKCKPSRNGTGVRYQMKNLPWGSCVFGPSTIMEPDGSDIKEMFFFDYRTIADLIDNYPDMEKQITAHFSEGKFKDSKMFSSVTQWEGGETSEERDRLFDIVDSAYNLKSGTNGLVHVIMHLFPIKRKEEVWVNIFDDSGEDYEVRPPDWNDERWQRWIEENKEQYHGPYEREAVTLWVTVFTTSGLILANEKHWFQENGLLPCSFWLGAMSGGKPTGPAVDMADDCLANCVAEIECLDDLRKGSGRLYAVRAGAVENMEDLVQEANQALGTAVIAKDFKGPIGDAIHEFKREPNQNWKIYAEQRKQSMYETTRINEAMLGQHANRQSAIAKETEIAQALMVNAIYVDNINRSWQYHQNLKLKLIPYLYDKWETLEVRDEKTGKLQTLEVNAPQEFDAEGNVTSVINDLTAHRYRWKINPVDDSPTAQIRNAEEALNVINSAAGPLLQSDPTGMLFAKFLAAFSNPLLNEAGSEMIGAAQNASQAQAQAAQQKEMIDQTVLLAKAKAELLRAQKNGRFLNFKAEDLNNFPALFQLFVQLEQMADAKAEHELTQIQQQVAPQQPMMERQSAPMF